MSVLSAAAGTLGVGQWTELATTGFTESLLRPPDQDVGNTILDYGGTMAWDPVNRWMLFYNSGGHAPADRRVLRYQESNNTWDWYIQENEGWHVYDCFMVTPDNGHLWFWDVPRGGALYEFVGSSRVQRASGTGGSDYGAADFFPEANAFYSFKSDGFRRINRSTLTESSVAVGGSWSGYHHGCLYCPTTQVIIGYGGANANSWRVNQAGTVTANNAAPGGGLNSVGVGMTACPVTGTVLLLREDRSFHKMNSATGVWTSGYTNTFNIRGGTLDASQASICGPISTYGVVMFAVWNSSGSNKVYLYKHAQAGPPPIAPTALRVVP